ncbi:hypothetical protein FRC07_003354 [Ceratobasidium sp. 392]|nr:hypothetical protein FRC07_003354 [Ceratobasidium sp. 392]
MGWLTSSKGETPSESKANPDQLVKAFVNIAPAATYSFDGDRDATSAQLCRREPGKREECIQVSMAAKKLFETMQIIDAGHRTWGTFANYH